MFLIVASDWVAAFASHSANGTLFINTFGVKMDPSSGDGLSANDLASKVYDWIGPTYRECLPSYLTLDTVTVDKMPFPTTEQGVHAVGLAGSYVVSPDRPEEIAAIFSWKTDNPGRSGRGHIAFPVPAYSSLYTSNGQLFDLSYSYFTSHVANFFAALDAGADWGVGGLDGHVSQTVYSRHDAAGYDVKTRIVRPSPRWIERRQTSP